MERDTAVNRRRLEHTRYTEGKLGATLRQTMAEACPGLLTSPPKPHNPGATNMNPRSNLKTLKEK